MIYTISTKYNMIYCISADSPSNAIGICVQDAKVNEDEIVKVELDSKQNRILYSSKIPNK